MKRARFSRIPNTTVIAKFLLWRAWLDAREGRAQQAIARFRHGRPLLEA